MINLIDYLYTTYSHLYIWVCKYVVGVKPGTQGEGEGILKGKWIKFKDQYCMKDDL